ncbi:MAG: class I SAM-dependent methyltransferase [Acidimicrobiia bacterium]
MADTAREAGAGRFSGFADLYGQVRPSPPVELGELLGAYAGGRPALVVDLGSGTGLSTRWAATWSDEVVGVEPTDDMRAAAVAAGGEGISYRAGWSHDTGLPDGCADVVLAVQALHWMDPGPTFAEVRRLLRPGGVFAAVDVDWPPIVGDALVEEGWDRVRRRTRTFEARVAQGLTGEALRAPVDESSADAAKHSGSDAHVDRQLSDGVRSWSKTDHLRRMSASGAFRWCREIAMARHDTGDAARFVGLVRSQGDYQSLLRHGLDDHDLGIEDLVGLVTARLGDGARPWRFTYRARCGFT